VTQTHVRGGGALSSTTAVVPRRAAARSRVRAGSDAALAGLSPFVDDPRLAVGQLVATYDRGAHTRNNYDNRGRRRLATRQVAKPLSQQAVGSSLYAPHWYKTRTDFDYADRPTVKTSGADEGPFAVGLGTGEIYSYSSRGLLQSIFSTQHGFILSNITYEADGQPTQTVYGDAAATTATLQYQDQRRLDAYTVDRAPPSVWATASGNYSVPTAQTTQLKLAEFHYTYDLVGNPTLIEDRANAGDWSRDAGPQRGRRVGYDDLYRVTSVDYGYGTLTGSAPFQSPFAPEMIASNRHPVPLQTTLGTRVQNESFHVVAAEQSLVRERRSRSNR
jgi:hypothetical protein